MEVTPSGTTIEVREEQPLKQLSPREVRVEGRVTDVSVVLSPKIFWSPLISCKEVSLPRLLILVILTPLKANVCISVRLGSDKSSISSDIQPSKAL